MKIRDVKRDLTTLILYAIGFLLLWEWLRPVEQLTDTSNIWLFIMFAGVSLLLAYLGTPIILSGIVKIVFILYALHFLYGEGSFLSLSWAGSFLEDIFTNSETILNRDWPGLTNHFRSLLFFVLLWLMTYLVHYWLMNRRQIFIFFFMTMIYITVLDTFTPYEADMAIVRTIILGFAAMGILTYYRYLEKEGVKASLHFSRKWMLPLAIMIALSVGVGLAAPKADPIWPDPVPFIQSYSEDSGGPGPGIKKIGYGENDSQLGGPFIGDDTLVMRTEMQSRHYWKIETKDIYTGKGWIRSEDDEGEVFFGADEIVPIPELTEDVTSEKTERTSSVLNVMNYDHIAYPLGVQTITTNPELTYSLDSEIEKISTQNQTGRSTPAAEYEVTYQSSQYSVTTLQSSNRETELPAEIIERYTQLPESLPQRVRDLAVEITQDEDNWFDMARELESYFNSSGFTYDQQNVAVPGEDEDYVDQFLFDTKIGYCDNFSTAMVVLARSLDMPARWVKGFTEGDYIEGSGSGVSVYEVTNNNAHSWVEIFFPEVGWVPFEPTQGFTNNIQYNFDTETDTPAQQPETSEQPETPELEEDVTETASNSEGFSMTTMWNSFKSFVDRNTLWIILGVLIAAVIGWVFYLKRGRWLPRYYVWKMKNNSSNQDFTKAYFILLKELERYGLKRKEGQTLRDYAAYIDQFFSSNEMGELTSNYELLLYRGKLDEDSFKKTKELWENLIKKTIA
ncbi:MAG: transglutaminaseTgpA domain-containing protein [Cytobacillus gottheilii]|uniref:transglutaminaseTgpA domain-containing protein n=1 Tax=Cytobacillus gottheilii TaxID=859144 RepID=UPI00083256F0|nr:transglutaminaseTgpA domain-containing protein [Cytobacillus gottheilii]